MFNKIKSMLTNGRFKSKGITWQDNIRPGCSAGFPFLCGTNGVYDNAFPDITRIAESFAEVTPYAIDSKGKRIEKPPRVLEALYNPNEEMSGAEFLETLIVMMLVHPTAYILVWRYDGGEVKAGGPITKDNIAGFTFLQSPSVSRVGDSVQYFTEDGVYTQNDVITLSLNVNPYNVLQGYSPSQAVKKWATVDDYIAEYQMGVFRNGAVPAGEMIITAPTIEEYNAIVDQLQAAHRGANNANNIVYTHRPTSSLDGKPMAAAVEWVPFAQSNKEMTLESLFNQANKKIDMNFGVPEEVKGYLQNSNYASAEVADYVFSRRVLYPKLVKVYSRLNHELNRIMGGMGVAITFDYELPVLTDTRKVQTETLQMLIGSGFSVESAVAALQLPRSFLQLESGAKPEEVAQIENNDANLPHQSQKNAKAKSISRIEVDQNSTVARLLAIYNLYNINTVINGQQVSPEILGLLKNLIVASLYYQMLRREINKQSEYSHLIDAPQTAAIVTTQQLMQLNLAIQAEAARLEATLESGDQLTGHLLDGENIAEIKDAILLVDMELAKFGLQRVIESVDADNYHEQLDRLIEAFGNQTIKQIESLGEITELTTEERLDISQAIRETNNYRVNRWATSEEHRAEELGNLLAAEEVTVESDLVPMKVWHIREGADNVCADCNAINSEKVPVDQPFSNGDMVPHYHPNCHCWMEIVFEETKKSVKVTCPHCNRYMFESTGGTMKNVICANSKCKRHYDISVNGGKIEAKERDK